MFALKTDVPPDPEVHVVGILVQTRPERVREVAAALSVLPNTEVQTAAPNGRIVVVCVCAGADEALELIARIRELPGVLNVALVYQHAESAAAMEEEIDREDDPPRLH